MRSGTSSLICLGLMMALATTVPSHAAGAVGPNAVSDGVSRLRIGFLEPVDSLNPFIGIDDPSYLLYGLIYDYLFSFDQDGNYVGNLAADARCTDATCQNWTYAIRQDVLWSDNTSFSATDVNFTINYNIQNFFQLWAFEPYVNRIVSCTSANRPHCGAVQTGPSEVTVYFDRPFAPGRSLFVPILEKAQWQNISPTQAQYMFGNPNPIGTGPFVADPNIYGEWVNHEPLHLLKNPRYHAVGNHTGAPSLDDLYLEQFPDADSLAFALKNDEIDLAFMTARSIGQLEGQPNIETQAAPLVTQLFNEIGFSQVTSPSISLNPARYDIALRQALAMATNKDYIVQKLYGAQGLRGADLISPVATGWSYDPVADGNNLTFDPTAANALLNASGYTTWIADPLGICPNGVRSATSGRTVIANDNRNTNDTITIPAGQPLTFAMAVGSLFPAEVDTAAYVQGQWCQVGVSVLVKIEPSESALASDVYGGRVETYIWDWSGDPDPNYLLSIESGYTLDGWNDNFWNNGTYNAEYRAQLAALNLTARQELVRGAQRTHYTSAVYIVYIYPYGEWAYRTNALLGWGNWSAHPYRQPDAPWGANPLFLDLHLLTVSVALSGAEGRPGHPIAVTASVNATITGVWTLDWGDGTASSGTFSPGASNLSESHTYAIDGTYTALLTAQTSFDTVRASNAITVDGTPPATQASLSGTLGVPPWYVSPVRIALFASDGGTGVAGTSYRIDNGTWQAYTAPFQVVFGGWYAIEYNSTDRVGNAEATHSIGFGIDTQAPTASASVTGTLGLNGWYTSNVSVALNGTDATSGVARISYAIDGGPSTDFQQPFVLSDGTHTVSYQAVDAAGNIEGSLSRTLRIDTAPPILRLDGLPATVTSPDIMVSWIATDAVSGIAAYSLSVDGGPFQGVGTDTHASLRLSDGQHVITVRAVDVAGNAAMQAIIFTVDTNIFSPSGPYAGIPTYAIVGGAAALAAAVVWRRRAKSRPRRPGS